MIYQTHPNGPPQGLERAEVAHVRLGARLYLADPRRTPVKVIAHAPQSASFTVQVTDFEDCGAVWQFALWEAGDFLVPRAAPRLSAAEVAALSQRSDHLNRWQVITPNAAQRRQSLDAIARHQKAFANTLQQRSLPRNGAALLASTATCPAWSDFARTCFEAHGLAGIDAELTAAYASHPGAHQTVMAHRIVLAQMGLCAYHGPVLRDPSVLAAPTSDAQRRAHIVLRLGLVRAMFDHLSLTHLRVHRGWAGPDRPRNPPTFVSTSAQPAVADALALGQSGGHNVQADIPIHRVFATFIETPAFSSPYQEAEVLLMHAPGAQPF